MIKNFLKFSIFYTILILYVWPNSVLAKGKPIRSPSPSPAVTASPTPQLISTPTPGASLVSSATPTPSQAVLTGDIDNNGKVDIFDYNILLTNFGRTGTGIAGDIDNSGKVDIFDYNLLLTNFGK